MRAGQPVKLIMGGFRCGDFRPRISFQFLADRRYSPRQLSPGGNVATLGLFLFTYSSGISACDCAVATHSREKGSI